MSPLSGQEKVPTTEKTSGPSLLNTGSVGLALPVKLCAFDDAGAMPCPLGQLPCRCRCSGHTPRIGWSSPLSLINIQRQAEQKDHHANADGQCPYNDGAMPDEALANEGEADEDEGDGGDVHRGCARYDCA
jgi:hypothetical protein